MAVDIPIWPGSSSFSTGSTPYGFYDDDVDFQSEADKVAKWCAIRLGYPITDVELQDIDFYACFEEAVSEYSNQVNQFNIQQNLLSLIGSTTGSNVTHRNISANLGGVVQLAEEYGVEAGTNGNVTVYSASIAVTQSIQKYDLNALVRDVHAPSQSIEIKKVHHYASPAALRFYDPYLGNQAMLDSFGFGAYSAGVSFLMMPMYADLLRVQAIEFNDLMRKSSYGFDLHNNVLTILPDPAKNFTLWLEYIVKEDRSDPLKYSGGTVSDMSNAPYQRMQYIHINSVGRQWIYKYALAMAKETLGWIRSKYGNSIPIPNAETQLNGSELLSAAQTERDQLIQELREMLETTTRQRLLEAKANESEQLNNSLNFIPLKVYIG